MNGKQSRKSLHGRSKRRLTGGLTDRTEGRTAWRPATQWLSSGLIERRVGSTVSKSGSVLYTFSFHDCCEVITISRWRRICIWSMHTFFKIYFIVLIVNFEQGHDFNSKRDRWHHSWSQTYVPLFKFFFKSVNTFEGSLRPFHEPGVPCGSPSSPLFPLFFLGTLGL